jgi:hypothetical protein
LPPRREIFDLCSTGYIAVSIIQLGCDCQSPLCRLRLHPESSRYNEVQGQVLDYQTLDVHILKWAGTNKLEDGTTNVVVVLENWPTG